MLLRKKGSIFLVFFSLWIFGWNSGLSASEGEEELYDPLCGCLKSFFGSKPHQVTPIGVKDPRWNGKRRPSVGLIFAPLEDFGEFCPQQFTRSACLKHNRKKSDCEDTLDLEEGNAPELLGVLTACLQRRMEALCKVAKQSENLHIQNITNALRRTNSRVNFLSINPQNDRLLIDAMRKSIDFLCDSLKQLRNSGVFTKEHVASANNTLEVNDPLKDLDSFWKMGPLIIKSYEAFSKSVKIHPQGGGDPIVIITSPSDEEDEFS